MLASEMATTQHCLSRHDLLVCRGQQKFRQHTTQLKQMRRHTCCPCWSCTMRAASSGTICEGSTASGWTFMSPSLRWVRQHTIDPCGHAISFSMNCCNAAKLLHQTSQCCSAVSLLMADIRQCAPASTSNSCTQFHVA